MTRYLSAFTLLAAGCFSPNRSSGDGTATGSESTDGSAANGPGDASNSTGGGSGSADDAADSGSGSSGDATTGGPGACDPFAQDCDAGFKCQPPYTTLGEPVCVPIPQDPDQVGENCTFGGGTDSCDVGSTCLDSDYPTQGATGIQAWSGVCVALCGNEPDNPTCPDPGTACVSDVDSPELSVCLLNCNPVLQDCGDSGFCYPQDGEFVCLNPVAVAAFGQSCVFDTECAPTLLCAAASMIPGCSGDGCCTPFCDLTDPMDPCIALDPSIVCDAFDPDPPPGLQDVGVCRLPN